MLPYIWIPDATMSSATFTFKRQVKEHLYYMTKMN